MKRIIPLLCLISLLGCATSRGFDRGALASEVTSRSRGAAREALTDREIRRVAELRPQLPRRFRLGVFFASPQSRSWQPWDWQPEDKERILAVGETLERYGLVRDTVYLSPAIATGEDLESIRLTAARHGVDAVLVVHGISDLDHYNNILSPLYALLVTGWFIPGSVVDGLFVSHAALWDVRNGYLYASVEADGTASSTRPALLMNKDEVVTASRQRALETLAASVEQHVLNLRH